MKYVLDSSVAVKWGLREADSDKADALREEFRLAVHEFITPDVFTVEVCHALTRAERQGRLVVGQARELFLDLLMTAPQFFHPV